MADYGKKVQADNRHLSNLTSARFVTVDGGNSPVTVIATTSGCRLLRIILNTNGNTVTANTGGRQICSIAADAPEGSFNYGVYCPDGLSIVLGGAVNATIVFNV